MEKQQKKKKCSSKEHGEVDAFNYCVSLTDISISKGVNSIGQRAFSNCSNLEVVRISEGVTKIGRNAFCGCKNIKTVFVGTSTKVWNKLILHPNN